jgi:hypothetical protein
MSQTSVAEQAAAFEGQIADSAFGDVVSRLAEGAVPFGKFVCLGTNKDTQCKLPAAAADITDVKKRLGVSVRSHAIESAPAVALPTYPDKAEVSVLKKRRIYVKVEQAVVATDDVYVRFVAGGNGLGSFGNTAGAGPDRALLADARYVKAAGANEMAILELDL